MAMSALPAPPEETGADAHARAAVVVLLLLHRRRRYSTGEHEGRIVRQHGAELVGVVAEVVLRPPALLLARARDDREQDRIVHDRLAAVDVGDDRVFAVAGEELRVRRGKAERAARAQED